MSMKGLDGLADSGQPGFAGRDIYAIAENCYVAAAQYCGIMFRNDVFRLTLLNRRTLRIRNSIFYELYMQYQGDRGRMLTVSNNFRSATQQLRNVKGKFSIKDIVKLADAQAGGQAYMA